VRNLSAKTFESLYQGNPAPEDGDFFQRDWLKTYQPSELPRHLRYYMTGDFAVSSEQIRDSTVLMPWGIDEQDHIWILPETMWFRFESDDMVEALLMLFQRFKPISFIGEKGQIAKTIGPFLKKRMREESTYVAINGIAPIRNKTSRAQSIRGRMSMGMVHFPAFAPWWGEAESELLKFPSAKHDDFVDALSLIGLGIDQHISTQSPKQKQEVPKAGTMAWIKWAGKWADRMKCAAKAEGY